MFIYNKLLVSYGNHYVGFKNETDSRINIFTWKMSNYITNIMSP